MAQRRMIGKSVIQTQKFLKLPLETQALYFHLISNADDDGVVEGFPVVRMIGASDDSLGLLVVKQFIKPLNDEMVYFIIDFEEQNTIRKDRYKPSKYNGLIVMQPTDNQMATNGLPTDNQMATNGLPSDNQMATQYRLGKVSIDKDKLEYSNQEINQPSLEKIETISENETLRNMDTKNKFKVYSDLYPKKTKKREAFEAFKNLSDDEIGKLMIGAENVLTVSKTMNVDEFKFLKNQATFITDEAYLDYQTLQPTAPVGSRTPEWAKEEKKKVVREW